MPQTTNDPAAQPPIAADSTGRPLRVAVVGAGLAGLICARTLADHGHAVTVFDKGRSPGGRATSRHEGGERVFDHGAQFFTARGAWLRRQVASWEQAGVVARWSPRLLGPTSSAMRSPAGAPARADEAWWVGAPRMGALAAHLARGLELRLAHTVTALSRSGDGWQIALTGAGEPTPPAHQADALVIAVPAAQCAALLAPGGAPLPGLAVWASAIDAGAQTPCWSVMVSVEGAPDLGADLFEEGVEEGVEDGADPVAWAAREGSKPGRTPPPGEELWTLHASTAWSQAHLEDTPDSVARALTSAFFGRHAPAGVSIVHTRAHRWRFARGVASAPGAPPGPLLDAGSRLAICGDWLQAARVEGALESGVAAAGLLLGALASSR